MVKILHRSSLGSGPARAGGVRVGDPDFSDLLDRIFDKGMVFNAADRISLADHEETILARQEAV